MDAARLNGERLPAAKALGESLGVSLHTVLHAYQDLRHQGLIELRRGRGAGVIAPETATREHAARILDEDDAPTGDRAGPAARHCTAH